MLCDTWKAAVMLLLLAVSGESTATSIGTGGVSTAFSKGSTSLGIVAGSGSAFRENYLILGVGIGYYLVQGLEVGVDIQHWFSGSPGITKVSPQVRYVFTRMKPIKPYVGAFYRRTYIEGLNDEDSLGYRAGAYFSSRNGVNFGGGIVYEEYSDCSAFIDCSSTYPEILFSVSF